ncbi:MAG: hypothetical protein QXL43_02380 [Methanolinea sp.]
MPPRRSDEALSEVIGFILILALIAALASLYVTYVVPAQGRELEIKHMEKVYDQFLQYKATVDSLWVNDQRNVPVSSTFTLGTVTGLTQGGFVIPVFQPYPSSGTVVVNGRGDRITIFTECLKDAPGSAFPNVNAPFPYRPGHLFIRMRTTDTTRLGGLVLEPVNGNWLVYLNVTRVVNSSSVTTGVVPPFPTPTEAPSSISWTELRNWINNNLNNPGGWISQINTNITSTTTSVPSITMTLRKNNYPVFSELLVVRNITNNTWYTIDLLDEAYGLKNEINIPFDLRQPLNATSNWIQYEYPGNVGFSTAQITDSHPVGSLEFRSGNNYWIQQNYYFQQGGIFLEQPDGKVAKVIPLVSVTNKTGIPTVRVVDVTIDGSASVGGTSPVQAITTVQSIEDNVIGGQKLATGIPNARNVTLVVEAQDQSTAQAWNQTFARVRSAALGEGFPAAWIPVPVQSGNTVQFTVSALNYSVFFDYTRVNMTVSLQAVPV